MNYYKEKVCGWHDAHIGLYTSVRKSEGQVENQRDEIRGTGF